ncbi:MAG: COX15/CtaA family protein [Bacteroidia bacterium]|nr:COX15/CtaA family protein [Bacteroidia bacterium]
MIAGLTTGAVVFLILVGGIVRMTGSGMGCPDWPRCFGQWVPPTDISQLPADYKQQFAVAGKEIADFDPFKTWVEYINRLLGVLIGFFAIGTAVYSLRLWNSMRVVTLMSVAALLLVIVQGGIGAYVVRTDLKTNIVTIHMVMALLIVAVLELARLRTFQAAYQQRGRPDALTSGLGWLLLGLILVQIIMGTQVREAVDEIAREMGESRRQEWVSALTGVYHVHKFFYYVIAGVGAYWVYRLRQWNHWSAIVRQAYAMLAVLGAEVLLGIGMHRLGIPAFMQPLHLLLATLLFVVVLGMVVTLGLSHGRAYSEWVAEK